MNLTEAIAGKIANKTASELKGLGATKETLIQIGFAAADLDILFTTVTTPMFGVSTAFLKTNGIKGTERAYIIPNFSLGHKEDARLDSVIYGLSTANKLLYPNYPSVLKDEQSILAAKEDGTIIKYSSIGCFTTTAGKVYRMGILDSVIDRISNEYTLYCSAKAATNSPTKSYDVVEILER